MKYFIYIILISGFIGFVTYATIETNKTISQNPDSNTSVVADANTANDLTATPIEPPYVDTSTIIPNDTTSTNNIIKKSPTKVRYKNNEREDD